MTNETNNVQHPGSDRLRELIAKYFDASLTVRLLEAKAEKHGVLPPATDADGLSDADRAFLARLNVIWSE